MNDLKQVINNYFSQAAHLLILLLVFLTFFLFTNLTTEFYDTAKFLGLLLITGILLILLTLKFTLNGKVVFVRTPLDIPLLLLLTVGIVSAILSPHFFVSLLGNQLKIYPSLSALAVLVILYFVLVNSFKGARGVRWIFFIISAAGALLGVISLLSYAGLKLLPPPWAHTTNFTPAGSSFSTTAILALLIPIVTSQILNFRNYILLTANCLLLTLFGATIALTGSFSTWTAALLGFLLTLASNRHWYIPQMKDPQTKVWGFLADAMKPVAAASLTIPVVVTALVTILSFIPPMGGANNPLYTQAKNFPKEQQLGLINSWKIAVSAFRDNPFWGSGLGSFAFDFTNYKPIEFNSKKEWNLRFDSPFNEYLHILATLGGVGLIALLSLTALYISSSYKAIVNHQLGAENAQKKSVAIAGLAFFIILALHPATLVVWIFGLILLSSFMALNLSADSSKSWVFSEGKTSFLKIAKNVSSINPSEETIKADALPSILLNAAVVLSLAAFFFAGKFALADYHHRLALNAVSQNQGVIAYNGLIAAEKLNPHADLYRVDLAQVNFALANAIAAAKGPTEVSPAGSLTDQDKQNIQVLLQQSINEGRLATTLSPKSAINWEILGLLYRQIAGVAQNALIFSLDSYGRAIFQDPLNPQLRLNVGGVYYAIQNYDLAIRFFTDAINLKPDFANGYYNLSVALKDKGDLGSAQAAAEKVLTLVELDSQDFKVANDYLTELKNKISSTQTPPASKTTGSLQEEKLPKVVDVGNPPKKIATPSAVKKPNSTPEPEPSP